MATGQFSLASRWVNSVCVCVFKRWRCLKLPHVQNLFYSHFFYIRKYIRQSVIEGELSVTYLIRILSIKNIPKCIRTVSTRRRSVFPAFYATKLYQRISHDSRKMETGEGQSIEVAASKYFRLTQKNIKSCEILSLGECGACRGRRVWGQRERQIEIEICRERNLYRFTDKSKDGGIDKKNQEGREM